VFTPLPLIGGDCKCIYPTPLSGGLDLNSSNSGIWLGNFNFFTPPLSGGLDLSCNLSNTFIVSMPVPLPGTLLPVCEANSSVPRVVHVACGLCNRDPYKKKLRPLYAALPSPPQAPEGQRSAARPPREDARAV